MVKTIVPIVIVYLIAVVGWVTLAGTITSRTDNQDAELRREVGQLWGTQLEQIAPKASVSVDKPVEGKKWESDPKRAFTQQTTVTEKYEISPAQNDINIGFQ